MSSITDILPFCGNANVCQIIVIVYVVAAAIVSLAIFSSVHWIYKKFSDAKAKDFIEFYYSLGRKEK